MGETTRSGSVRRYAGQARTFARFATGLRAYLRTPLTTASCVDRVRDRLRDRERSFATLVRRAIFENPASPYRPLLAHAGVEMGDVESLLAADGVDGTLAALHDAGVYVRLDEFKGNAPVERPGLSYEVTAAQFDNPLLDPVYRARTGGSTGVARVVQIDFTAMEHAAAYHGLFLEMFDAARRPQVLWRPVPPGWAGFNNLLSLNKVGVPIDRWYTQTWPGGGLAGAAERAVLHYAVFACRRWGAGVGEVERVPLEDAARVARHLADLTRAGTPALLSAPASSGARVARAAIEGGIDIAGTFFRVGGEPLTEAKAALAASAGCRITANYSMTELGRIGIGCADPAAVDDVHVMTDHVGLLQRRQDAPYAGSPVDALWLSTLNEACRKVMLNVESGDHAIAQERQCGCAAGALGLTLHLHGIRSHDKLTSEGMNFLAADVVALVEDVLPRRFGGGLGDYQLVEREVDGLPTLTVVVQPRVGAVDDADVVEEVLATLRQGASFKRMMTSVLEGGRTMRVVRAEPFETSAAKVPAVHIVRS